MNTFGRYLCFAFVMLFLAACNKNLSSTQPDGLPASSSDSVSAITSSGSAASTNTTPITTPHYSLVLPEDWGVLYGPVKERGTTRFQLIDKAKTSTVSITVGPSQAGDAEAMARRIADRLQTKAENKDGQWQCHFVHEKSSGYAIIREDPANALLLVLTASGDIQKADFVFQMRSPYAALIPRKL